MKVRQRYLPALTAPHHYLAFLHAGATHVPQNAAPRSRTHITAALPARLALQHRRHVAPPYPSYYLK